MNNAGGAGVEERGVEIKVGNNAGQSKHPIIKITFYLCLKKKITKYKIK